METESKMRSSSLTVETPTFVEDPEEDVDGDGLGWAQEMADYTNPWVKAATMY